MRGSEDLLLVESALKITVPFKWIVSSRSLHVEALLVGARKGVAEIRVKVLGRGVLDLKA